MRIAIFMATASLASLLAVAVVGCSSSGNSGGGGNGSSGGSSGGASGSNGGGNLSTADKACQNENSVEACQYCCQDNHQDLLRLCKMGKLAMRPHATPTPRAPHGQPATMPAATLSILGRIPERILGRIPERILWTTAN
jgi:hypothetical protein